MYIDEEQINFLTWNLHFVETWVCLKLIQSIELQKEKLGDIFHIFLTIVWIKLLFCLYLHYEFRGI